MMDSQCGKCCQVAAPFSLPMVAIWHHLRTLPSGAESGVLKNHELAVLLSMLYQLPEIGQIAA